MGCLVLPVSALVRSRRWGSRVGYRPWYRRKNLAIRMVVYRPMVSEEEFSDPDGRLVTVVVRKEFLVDGLLLEEYPFRDLIDLLKKDRLAKHERRRSVVFVVGVDSILFEHILWLMYNDSPSLSELYLKDIIDFYAQD